MIINSSLSDLSDLSISSNDTVVSITTNCSSSNVYSLSSLQKHFLAVFILAAINAVLGAIYLLITHMGRRKSSQHGHVVMSMNRRSQEMGGMDRKRKRRMSTHIAVSMGKHKQRR